MWTDITADASRMYCIGQVTPEARKLVDVTKECLELSLKVVHPGGYLNEIGAIIQEHAEKNGFSVVPDICGHEWDWISTRSPWYFT